MRRHPPALARILPAVAAALAVAAGGAAALADTAYPDRPVRIVLPYGPGGVADVRIAWGSNFPNSVGTLKEILGAARQAFSFASSSDQDRIFGKTAQGLYPSLKD